MGAGGRGKSPILASTKKIMLVLFSCAIAGNQYQRNANTSFLETICAAAAPNAAQRPTLTKILWVFCHFIQPSTLCILL
jgi:hypothetical protein